MPLLDLDDLHDRGRGSDGIFFSAAADKRNSACQQKHRREAMLSNWARERKRFSAKFNSTHQKIRRFLTGGFKVEDTASRFRAGKKWEIFGFHAVEQK